MVELKKQGDDAVLEWCTSQTDLFLPFDNTIQIKAASILSTHSNLVDSGKGRSGADPFVIALAELNSCTVITGEAETFNAKKPRIPDVCRDRKVKCGNFLHMILSEKWTF